MASGRTHDKLVIFGVFLTLPLAALNPLTFFTSAGCLLGGLLISPDIDLGENEKRPPRPVKRLRALRIWWFWSPFALIKHRHIWSHLPGLCTVLKILWLWLALYVPINFLLLQFTPYSLPALATKEGVTLFGSAMTHAAIGLFIADCIHWAADRFPIKF